MPATNPTHKLSLWGAAHAAARDAERAAAQAGGQARDELRHRARVLRERADRLHREAYLELEPRREPGTGAKPHAG